MTDIEGDMNKKLRKLQVPLRAKWDPNPESKLSGEVKGGVLYIYEEDPKKAYETFWHELIDFYVSRAAEPYRILLNAVIRAVNDDAHKRKDESVEALRKIVEGMTNESEW